LPEEDFSFFLRSFSNLPGRIFGLGFCPLRRAISSLSSCISSACSRLDTDICSIISSSCKIRGVFSSSGIVGICIIGSLMHCAYSTHPEQCPALFYVLPELIEKLPECDLMSCSYRHLCGEQNDREGRDQTAKSTLILYTCLAGRLRISSIPVSSTISLRAFSIISISCAINVNQIL